MKNQGRWDLGFLFILNIKNFLIKKSNRIGWKLAIFYAFFCALSIIICGYFISWFEPLYVWEYVDIQKCTW